MHAFRVGGACGPPPPGAAPLASSLHAPSRGDPPLEARFARCCCASRVIAILALGLLVGCSGPAAAPTLVPTSAPTPVPTSTPVPAATPIAATSSDVENAYLSNVDDLIAEAADLAVTPCDELTAVTRANPNLVPSVRGFATALKR